jgi:hypothetical protein
MKNLSAFIKDEFVKKDIDKFFENSICIDTIEQANKMALNVSYGAYANFVFENTICKNNFLDKLHTVRTDINVINCNCTVNSFFENSFNGFLVFNNLKHCQHKEIIEEIKKHKSILLC